MKYPFFDLGAATAACADDLKAAAARVIDSGRYIGGAECEAFEAELAAATGVPYAVGVSNGLDALRLIFKALILLGRLSEGDEVIVPANTYIASVLAVTDAGLVPVFVEPDPRTLNIDSSRIEEVINLRTRAILTVHLYGRVAYDTTMREVAENYGLIVVEDNAQAIGAESAVAAPSGAVKAGALGMAAAFSFYPTKNIGAIGDAGAVTTSDRELADAVRALANYGSDRRYHNIYQGYNCRLDPIQAAFLRVKLAHLDDETARRRAVAAAYSEAIDSPYVTTPLLDAPDRSVWHQYVIRSKHREALRKYLEDNGVATDIHYAVPPHRQPCYVEYAHLQLPVTEQLADEVLSLPIATASIDDARAIARIINNFHS
ncbi:MAG: DegT/DnrJ/EryC1/StrS family aminotransferase [Muribaculaceae bacterium]|nr:DegT/DnrJ/EryC1/StrS family aminotransferase [Muribaculaceae bacterium]